MNLTFIAGIRTGSCKIMSWHDKDYICFKITKVDIRNEFWNQRQHTMSFVSWRCDGEGGRGGRTCAWYLVIDAGLHI